MVKKFSNFVSGNYAQFLELHNVVMGDNMFSVWVDNCGFGSK